MVTLLADKPTDAIAALLQERQRYEQWLAALESRRATTPAHVYARVHTDYESRLARVLDELGGRSAELRQVVDDLTERVTALQTEENTHRDERAEAELRAAVGEYSAEQWREVSQSSEADIARVAARRAEAASELAQVQQLLNMATSTSRRSEATAAPAAGPPAGAAPAGAGSAGPMKTERGGAAADAAQAQRPAAPAGQRPEVTFDELAFLHSVVEPRGDTVAGASAQAAGGDSPKRGSTGAVGGRGKTPTATAAGVGQAAGASHRSAAAPAAPQRAAAPMTPADIRAVNSGETTDSLAEGPRNAPSESSVVPTFLRDVPSEQIKTLKCAECGNMNYPTEWYCERCGGELAAM